MKSINQYRYLLFYHVNHTSQDVKILLRKIFLLLWQNARFCLLKVPLEDKFDKGTFSRVNTYNEGN